MTSLTLLSDRELLDEVDRDPDAFAVFYRRHLSGVLGFAVARTHSRELAADLAAEVFAAALESRSAFDPARGDARPWLCGIAAHKLYDSWRRGVIEATARHRLAMTSIPFDDSDLERVDEIATAEAQLGQLAALLDQLPPDVRAAVQARVVDEDDYRDIALRLQCSEQVVRKRVSRGLQSLRTRLRVDDA